MKYIDSEDSITIIFNGDWRPKVVSSSHQFFNEIVEAAMADDEEEVKKLLEKKVSEAIQERLPKGSGLVVDDDGVYYYGHKLHYVIAQKVFDLYQSGAESFENYFNFLKNLMQNPSPASLNELYDFLQYKALAITEDGCFIAYKGVNEDGWSVTGNLNTIVKQGKVDESGRIFNGVGETIEVERNQVDDNRNIHCSHGLHVGSWDYASTFGSAVLAVKVNPRDVVSIPNDCECQKARVCRYEVMQLISNEIAAPAVQEEEDEEGNVTLQPVTRVAEDEVLTFITNHEWEKITLKRIQSALPQLRLKVREIEQILKDNNYEIEYSNSLGSSAIDWGL